MSSEQDVSGVSLQDVANFRTTVYFLLSALVLLLFDTIVTLAREVDLVWLGGVKSVTLLYYLVRYPLLLGWVVLLMLQTGVVSPQNCTPVLRLSEIMIPLSHIGMQWLMIIRTYAICDKNIRVLIALGILSTASLVPPLVEIATNTCASGSNRLANVENILSGALILLFDTAVIFMTVRQTLGVVRLAKVQGRGRPNLPRLILRQGVERYILIWIVLIGLVASNQLLHGSLYNVFLPLSESLQAIILCRFFLDLRDIHASRLTDSNLPDTSFTTFRVGLHETTRYRGVVVAEESFLRLPGNDIQLDEWPLRKTIHAPV